MAQLSQIKTILSEFDQSEDALPPDQMRQLNTLCHTIYHAAITDDEGEFFEGSAEALRMCASLIKQSRFGRKSSANYAEQALEYSIEMLQDYIETAKIITYDN